MNKIMFVCTGNVCRSAMANAYMQYLVNQRSDKSDFLISSCGINAVTGESATDFAILAMKNYNVDLSSHRAKNINDIDIENYDIILCMTDFQKNNVRTLYPKLSEKIFTLKEYVNQYEKYLDIDDPWGLSKIVYDDCAKEIVRSVDELLNKLVGD